MNPSIPNPSPRGAADEMNEAVLKKLQSHLWKGRALAAFALCVGLLSIVVGISIAWASSTMVAPMERLLLQDYPGALKHPDANPAAPNPPAAKPPLTREQLDWRHAQVTAAHGKVIILVAMASALTGLGTLLTLLLVIFNRRATLRQVNATLARISHQLKELQHAKSSGAAQ